MAFASSSPQASYGALPSSSPSRNCSRRTKESSRRSALYQFSPAAIVSTPESTGLTEGCRRLIPESIRNDAPRRHWRWRPSTGLLLRRRLLRLRNLSQRVRLAGGGLLDPRHRGRHRLLAGRGRRPRRWEDALLRRWDDQWRLPRALAVLVLQ